MAQFAFDVDVASTVGEEFDPIRRPSLHCCSPCFPFEPKLDLNSPQAMPSRRPYIYLTFAVWGCFALACGIASNMLDDTNPWGRFHDVQNSWCEQERPYNWMREPANAASDFCFLLVAFAMLFAHALSDYCVNRHDEAFNSSSPFRSRPLISCYFALWNTLHAVGTWLNHASHTQVGGFMVRPLCFLIFACSSSRALLRCCIFSSCALGAVVFAFSRISCALTPSCVFSAPICCAQDVVGMYNAAAQPFFFQLWLTLNSRRRRRGKEELEYWPFVVAHLLFALTNALLTAYGLLLDIAFLSTEIAFTIALLLYFWRLHRTQLDIRKPLVGALCLILGTVCWVLDTKKIWCDPTSPLQGHALWHALTAVTLYSVFLYLAEFRWEAKARSAAYDLLAPSYRPGSSSI